MTGFWVATVQRIHDPVSISRAPSRMRPRRPHPLGRWPKNARMLAMGQSAARSLAAILFALQLGCATANLPTRISDTLYFGFDRPGGSLVTESEWSAFLSEIVTPRFPDGLTVWQASGQWSTSAASSRNRSCASASGCRSRSEEGRRPAACRRASSPGG